ncbi:MAG: DUF2231 domain-containing protein [Candidatus Omnitrophica bacterium]|nr:DUF2231 domain-containing protein [Candidatus Omnitrophota bacterium]MDE2215465.1 DUF2231 domain-containing protein [Candidatus Omnitrophota bacterium]
MNLLAKLLPGAGNLQNLHPLAVHFPIAFLTAAGFIYVLAYVLRRDAWARTAFWFLGLGCLTAAVAVMTGLYAAGGVMVAKSVRQHLLHAHKLWMLATFYLSAILTLWAAFTNGFPKKGRLIFVVLSLILIAVMVKGADYGGRMVFDYNAGGDACGQPIEFSH